MVSNGMGCDEVYDELSDQHLLVLDPQRLIVHGNAIGSHGRSLCF